MEKILEKLSEEETVLPLINYLAIYQKEQDSKLLSEIINAATSGHPKADCQLHGIIKKNSKNNNNEQDGNTDNDVLRCFRMILVSRYTVGGFYAMQSEEQYDAFTDPTSLTPVKLLDESTYWPVENSTKTSCKIYPFKKIKYCNVLGRYDALSFTRTRPLCRCPLPYFDVKKVAEEEYEYNPYGFASLLTRREFGIRIDLNNKKQCVDHLNRDKSYGLIGAVSVTLKRRSLRIPFLARLLAAAQQENIGDIRKENLRIGLKKEQDTVLLLDGSVDFLILFCEKNEEPSESETEQSGPGAGRVGNIIDAAYWLYQDFMVERTETILDAIMLDDVVRSMTNKDNKEASPYSIECAIRFFEDQFLGDSVETFRKALFKRIKKKDNKSYNSVRSLLVMAELTPGRTDMCLRFFNDDFINKKNFINTDTENRAEWHFRLGEEPDFFRKQLVELLEPPDQEISYIDRIEINISKQPPR